MQDRSYPGNKITLAALNNKLDEIVRYVCNMHMWDKSKHFKMLIILTFYLLSFIKESNFYISKSVSRQDSEVRFKKKHTYYFSLQTIGFYSIKNACLAVC